MKLSNIMKFVYIITLFLFVSLIVLQCTKGEQPGEPPEATNVKIKGSGMVGDKLTGSYTFSDPEEDDEGESTYRWLIADTEDGNYRAIDGATSKTYTPKESDLHKFIKFEVTPVSVKEAKLGNPVQSDPIEIIPKEDVPDDVDEGYEVVYIRNQEELDQKIPQYKDQEKVKFKLAEGTYEINEVFDGSKKQWIQGEDKDKVILRGNIRYNNSDDVRISDLTLEHTEDVGNNYGVAFDNTKGAQVKNVKIKNAVENGIECKGSELDVTDSEFENNGASNILYHSNSKGTVSNITSNGAKTLDGVSVSESEVIVKDSTFDANNQTGVFFYDNAKGKIVNCNSSGSKRLHGVEIRESEVDIEGGDFSGNKQSGIQYKDSKGTITGVTANNNQNLQGIAITNSTVDISDTTTNTNNQSGIYVFRSSKVTVANAISNENNINGVKIENSEVDIASSNFDSNSYSGILYEKSSGTIEGCNSKGSSGLFGFEAKDSTVTINNTILESNNKSGVMLYACRNSSFTSVEVLNNNEHGLLVDKSQLTISDSSIKNNKIFGLYAKSHSNVTLSNVSFEENGRKDINRSSSVVKETTEN
jgi:hypothetical protein